MRKLDIKNINKEELQRKLPLFYIPANYNKILCVKFSNLLTEPKYNLRDPALITELNKIFTPAYFNNKYGKYPVLDIKLYCLINWNDGILNSIEGICGVINDETIKVEEFQTFFDGIPPAEFKYIGNQESLQSILDNVNNQDLFIVDNKDDLEVYSLDN